MGAGLGDNNSNSTNSVLFSIIIVRVLKKSNGISRVKSVLAREEIRVMGQKQISCIIETTIQGFL